MKKVTAFEMDCRISNIYDRMTSCKSAKKGEFINEILMLHTAVEHLINAEPARKSERIIGRKADAIKAAYAYILQSSKG